MKKLTSSTTFFYKRIFPAIWFGFLGFFLFLYIFAYNRGEAPGLLFMIPILAMAAIGYFVMKKLVFDLIDEVYDDGSSLLFKNGSKNARIGLAEIEEIGYSIFSNPPKVTIILKQNSLLGKKLTFLPRMSLVPFKKNKDIDDLIERVNKARH